MILVQRSQFNPPQAVPPLLWYLLVGHDYLADTRLDCVMVGRRGSS